MNGHVLATIRDRHLDATPGSWVADHFGRGSVVHPEGSNKSILRLVDNTPCLTPGDAEFIAAAKDDVSLLIAEVTRLGEELDKGIAQEDLRRRLAWIDGFINTMAETYESRGETHEANLTRVIGRHVRDGAFHDVGAS